MWVYWHNWWLTLRQEKYNPRKSLSLAMESNVLVSPCVLMKLPSEINFSKLVCFQGKSATVVPFLTIATPSLAIIWPLLASTNIRVGGINGGKWTSNLLDKAGCKWSNNASTPTHIWNVTCIHTKPNSDKRLLRQLAALARSANGRVSQGIKPKHFSKSVWHSSRLTKTMHV